MTKEGVIGIYSLIEHNRTERVLGQGTLCVQSIPPCLRDDRMAAEQRFHQLMTVVIFQKGLPW